MRELAGARYAVDIDGVSELLTFDSHSGARGNQYLTTGNRASHAFPFALHDMEGQTFRTNGHTYYVKHRVY